MNRPPVRSNVVVHNPGVSGQGHYLDLSSPLYQLLDGQNRATATPDGLTPLRHPEDIGRAVAKPADTHANPGELRFHDSAGLVEKPKRRHPVVEEKLRRAGP